MEEKEMKALSMEDLDGVAGGYNKDMAYDVYMNNAFMCTCGQVIRPVKGWK